MKFSLDAVKGLDWKQFGIDHGEKIGLGAAALAVGAMLFLGRWTPYTATSPTGIENDVARQARLLSDSKLEPDRLAADAPAFDVAARARAVLKELRVDAVDIVQPVTAPLYPLQAPNGEPTWLPVETLVADAVTLPVRLIDEGAVTVADAGGTDPADEPAADDFGDFAVPGAGAGGASPPGFSGDPYGGDSGSDGNYVPGGPGASGFDEQTFGGPDSGSDGYGAPAANQNARGKGVKMVAVRGVFPYRRQVQELAKALGVPYAEAKTRLEFLDVEIERQRAAPGPNPWVEDWEPVDRAAAEALLAEDYSGSQGRSPEVVSLAVTDPSITFPLFTRGIGYWDGKDEATHDRIRDFNIGKEDQELERRARARLEELAGAAEEAAGTGGPRKRSFRGSAVDIRAAAADVAQEAPAGENEDPIMAEIRRLSAADVLLLTRFFDVAVEPGQAYRYRMRLVVANPNFGLGEADVSDRAALVGETRKTPWSDPSGVAAVPLDEYVFLASAKTGPAGESPQAEFEVTQFSRQYGTPISENIPRVRPGDLLVYEDRTTFILDPFKLEKDTKADYVFDTDHVVLGITALPDGAAELHPDLKLGDRSVPNGRAMLLLSTGAVAEVDAGLTPEREKVAGTVKLYREKLGAQLTDKNAAPPPSADPYGDPYGGSGSGFFDD